jgi:glutathione synthase/RimK-type ligase-like ATP-grasp enzyme
MLRHTLRLCRGGSYLLQQAVDNRLRNGQVYDFRLVVQKDGNGKWTLTGGAARVGGARSITSNLHGGGRAVAWQTMLMKQFTAKRSESIVNEMKTLSIRVAEALEQRYGRLCELGLDIAVDHGGKPWLLEVNPKPAREIFRKTGQHATYRTAIRRPLEFAIFLGRSHPKIQT